MMSNFKIALIGNPNSGKSTLFNAISGLNQKVGNYPGVTVDIKSSTISHNNFSFELIDLPGTYSIYPKSKDEEIVLNILSNPKSKYHPDLIVVVADASNLNRNLFLFSQIYDTRIPCLLCLNMIDIAEQKSMVFDIKGLSAKLGDLPIFKINARKKDGVPQLLDYITVYATSHTHKNTDQVYKFVPIPESVSGRLSTIVEITQTKPEIAYLIAHSYQKLDWLNALQKEEIKNWILTHQFDSIQLLTKESVLRYTQINQLVSQYVVQKQDFEKKSITQKLDSVFTHPLWGYVCMVAIFYLVFLSIFSWSEYPMQLIENIFFELNTWLQTVLPSNWFTSLLTDGVLAGIGGLLVFIPQIAFLFIFIGILEESGYMARIMFLMDRLMKPFGLNGKSIVPLFSGAACAIPAIMSCRGIANRKERLITIFITPLISCSARIPVYTIMIGLVIPVQYVWGVFNLQGLVMLGLYALGFAMALITAFALKLIVKSDEKSFFILEMPTYKIPSLRNIGLTVLDKVKSFITEAGKVILAISIVLWFLANNGFESNIQSAISEVDSKFIVEKDTLESYNFELAAARLEASYAGSIGKLIEPIISPLGFDWKIGIAILTSFAAREVFVGTLSTIYSVQDAEDFTRLREKMSLQKDKDGNPYFNLARGLSILVFYAFALQCMSTISVVYKETRSKKIVLFQLLYLSFLAYMSAFIVFNIF